MIHRFPPCSILVEILACLASASCGKIVSAIPANPTGTSSPTSLPLNAPISSVSSTPVPATLTSNPTEAPTATPDPVWLHIIKTQDQEGKFIIVKDGKPTIDLYDTTETSESIVLDEKSIQISATTDVLFPNILSAKDTEGNQYLFNPDTGWFKVPEIQMDYTKLEAYTPVTEDYFTDGRFALVSAFKYR